MSSYTTHTEDTDEIDFVTVHARVGGWRDRINALYQQLKGWSPAEYKWDTTQHLTMYEEMMKNYGVDPIELPVLSINDRSGWKAKIIPYGLWIIGGDGRLDLLTGARRYLITGVPPSMGSGWSISEPGFGLETKALTQSSWLAALQ